MKLLVLPSILAGSLTLLAACTAPTEGNGAESVGATAQADSATHSYFVQIQDVYISKTRSKYTDTDVASIGVKVNGVLGTPVTYRLGDVKDGDHPLWLTLQTPPIGPSDQVEILFSVVNEADGDSTAGHAADLLNSISDAAEKYVNSVYPLGPVWPAINSGIHWINNEFRGWCDGAVVADAVLASGSQLGDLTANGPQVVSNRYDGTDSNAGCGANSLYFMRYQVSQAW